jgi:hypothetical protein
VDIGGGRGEKVTRALRGGVVGLVFDARGRPLERGGRPGDWNAALDAGP